MSVLHEGSGRLLLKGAVPLSCLIPGQHYSLAVALSDACSLYLTLVLGLGEQPLMKAHITCGSADCEELHILGRLVSLRYNPPHVNIVSRLM